MLSLYTLKSAAEASTYYQQGDYYTGQGETYSQWLGKGAELLALEGKVEVACFKQLLEGRLPTGAEMIQTQQGGHHRPGYDLTFSAPKSVSVLALVAGRAEVLKAHQEAVTEVITKMEASYAACRLKKQGNVTIEKTGNFLAAAFEHHDSRAGDPNLHTHCVLMNITQRQDGVWRTLFADELYTDKLMNGMEYRSILAQKLMNLGYELTLGKKGTFEISGIPEPVLGTFSKRRVQIEKWLEDKNLEGGELAKVANYQTRAAKVTTNAETQKIRWEQELILSGSSLQALNQLSDNAKERGPLEVPDPYLGALASVTFAIEHLSEYRSHFTIQDILKSAKRMSVLPSSNGDFLKAIEQKIQDKSLLYQEDKLLTTPQLKEYQHLNVQSMQKGRDVINPMLSNRVAHYFAKTQLQTDYQQKALTFLLTNKDQQCLITFNSKLVMYEVLKTFHAVCVDQHYFPRILTQKQRNVENLKGNIGSEWVGTIEGFLSACDMRAEKQSQVHPLFQRLQSWSKQFKSREAREVWIIEGEVSDRQINRLQEWSKHFGTRMVFTEQKNHPLSALLPLKEKGLKSIEVLAVKSHPRESNLKEQLLEKINALEVRSLPTQTERLHAAVDLFTPHALLVTQTSVQSLALNALVRKKWQEQKVLLGESRIVDTLHRMPLSQVEKRQIHLYQLNDVIRFNQNKPDTLITHGSYFVVKKIDFNTGVMELHSRKALLFWAPANESMALKHVDVYRSEKREIQLGERVVWTKTFRNETDNALNRKQGETATVVGMHRDRFAVILQNGKRIELALKNLDNQHWDHGYAVLLKNAEVNAFEKVILCLQSNKVEPKTINDVQDLSKITHIVCDNVQTLKMAIEKSDLNRSTDFKSEIPYLRKEALSAHPTTVTQQIFHRLQAEYLNVRQINPEFLDKNVPSLGKPPEQYSPEFRMACDVVDYVCLSHSERNAVFDLKTIKKEAYEWGGISVPTKIIDGAFELAMSKGWLLKVPTDAQKDPTEILVCTRHTLLLEKLCIQKMKAGQNQLTPITPATSLLQEVQQHPRLTEGQKEAVSLVLTTSDRVISIQGIAGAGKTTVLREMNERCQACHFSILVLANTGSARNQAQNASGISASMTTAQFLTRVETMLITDPEQAHKDYGGNKLLILDEVSLVSTRETYRLLSVVEQLGIRLAVVGDFKQIGSIGAGEMFHDLLAYGISKAVMKENVRLKEQDAFQTMKHAYAGDMAKTVSSLRDAIQEMPVKSEALGWIVDFYLALTPEYRTQMLIITPLNEDRSFVNRAIREKLIDTGDLQGTSLKTAVFLPRDRHEIDKITAFTYEKSDFIRFNSHQPRFGVKAGEYVEVIDLDLKHHRLTLKKEDGELFYWAPKELQRASDIEIYRQQERELMKNDLIIFKRNNNDLNVFNGDKATILGIEGSEAKIALVNGNVITLDLSKNENKHLDYGYALTTHASQGREGLVLAYGEGPKPWEKKTSELKVGDRIVLPKGYIQSDPATYHCSKVVSVSKIDKTELTLKEQGGKVHIIQSENHQVWHYFPPAKDREAHEFPLSTTQKSFLIQITRSDDVCLVVPNIKDFQKTLEMHKGIGGSALSHFDPNWKALNQAVEKLVDNIKGKAERPEKAFVLSQKTENPKRQPSKFKQYQNQPRIDVNELEGRLATDRLGYAKRWLGPPRIVNGREARWGGKGSFCLILSGPKAGVWNNFEIGKRGKGLVSLYMELNNMSWKDALQELAKDSGVQGKENFSYTKLPSKEKEQKNYQQTKSAYAQKEYQKAISIKGTLAEKYLREDRGITGELPADFRFRANGIHLNTQKPTPALIAPYRDKDNKLIGFVRVFLSAEGGKYKETFVDATGKEIAATRKANVGLSAHGAVVVQKGVLPNTLYIAEGIETALSISSANPNHTVVASLSASQLKNVPINSAVEKVIICADNDPASSNTKKTVIEAVERHLSEGRRVFIALPPELSTGMKSDFNDLLKQGGPPAVRQALEQMVEIKNANILKTAEPRLSVTLQQILKTPEPISQSKSQTANRDIER